MSVCRQTACDDTDIVGQCPIGEVFHRAAESAHHLLGERAKNTKRVACGYRNFDHYRLRLLLNYGHIHEDHSPIRIRSRRPSIVS
ncbi:MAG: hypothetical protein LC808_18165 [Actinobacteria bacterium]|nr:hypothetical protein [Actinomycetota bacterium]